MKRLARMRQFHIVMMVVVLLIGCIGIVPVKAKNNLLVDYEAIVYNNDDGLSSSEANTIVQTEDGYIWIGSYAGLYRYDGNTFKLVGTEQGIMNVTCLFVDSQSRLWIGTNDKGIILMNQDEFTYFDKNSGLSSNSVRSIIEDSYGNIYVGTTGTVHVITKDNQVNTCEGIDNFNYIISMAMNEEGVLAGVTNAGDLFFWQDGKLLDSYMANESMDAFETLVYAGDNKFLISSANGYIYQADFNYDNVRFIQYYYSGELNGVRHIEVDDEGNCWLCCDNGIGYFDQDRQINVITYDEFNVSVEMMYQDYEGNYWFASSRQGVLKLTKNSFKNLYSAANMDADVVNSTYSHNGFLYIGTDTGLRIIDLENYGSITNELTEYIGDNRIRCITMDSKENLWFSVYGDCGLICYDNHGNIKSYNTTKYDITSNYFRSTLELKDGTIVAATSDGLNFIQNGNLVHTMDDEDGLYTTQILCLYEYGEYLLAGSDGDGIYVIQDYKVVNHITEANGLSSLIIMRMVPALDGFLLVTSNALCYMDSQFNVKALDKFPYANNFDVVVRENQEAWVLSSAGIYVADVRDIIDNRAYNYKLYNTNKGLKAALTANSWNYIDENENIYLSTANGVWLVSMQQSELQSYQYKMDISFDEMDADSIKKDGDTYVVSADTKRITIKPLLLSYNLNQPVTEYYLEGFDESPIRMSDDDVKMVSYTNLPYGTYQFHFRILDANTDDVLQEMVVPIVKEAKIWEQPWFYALIVVGCLVLVALISWVLAKMRSAKIIEQQYEEIKAAKNEAEKANATKSIFLANMSHEIRTPINSILGMDEMILRENEDPVIEEYASVIQSSGKTLLGIINDILDFSKIESGKMEIVEGDFDLRKTLSDIIQMASFRAQEHSLNFMYHIDETIPYQLYGDEIRLKQIMMNFLTNAIKYTKVGDVSLTVNWEPLANDEMYFICEVKDTGIGIKKENIKELFESFKRLDMVENRYVEGTGLGLNICNSLVQMMDGTIDIESEYGKGSTFTFRVKLTYKAEATIGAFTISQESAAAAAKSKTIFVAPKAHILVVDDNEVNLKVASALLKRTKVNVDIADSGAGCLEMVKNQHYDLIFMDHMMPQMDGVATLHHMKDSDHKCKDTPVIALTANAVKGAKKQYLDYGFDDYISKPIEFVEMENMMIQYLPDEMICYQEDEITEHATMVAEGAMDDLDERTYEEFKRIGIDLNVALKYASGDLDEVFSNMKIFIDDLDANMERLEAFGMHMQLEEYTALVHGLKSATLYIGAVKISQFSKELELAGKERNLEYIQNNEEAYRNGYRILCTALKKKLQDYDLKHQKLVVEQGEAVTKEEFLQKLEALRVAIDNMIADEIEACLKALEIVKIYDTTLSKCVLKLRAAFDSFDYDAMLQQIDEVLENVG